MKTKAELIGARMADLLIGSGVLGALLWGAYGLWGWYGVLFTFGASFFINRNIPK